MEIGSGCVHVCPPLRALISIHIKGTRINWLASSTAFQSHLGSIRVIGMALVT